MKGRRVLVAGPADVCRRLATALDDLHVVHCETLGEAVRQINEHDPHLIVVCYGFDEMRPFSLIHHVRSELQRPELPILLVQAVDWHLGNTQVSQMRNAYEGIGATAFINLREEIERHGEETALQRFRHTLVGWLGRSRST